jgi:FkbH-like protein
LSFDPVRATLISDFNLEVFSGYLKNDPQFPIVSPFVTPFGQVMQVLMDENMKCWEQFNDLAVVWTRPEGVINSFQKALDFRPVNFEKALEEVDAFSGALSQLTGRVKTLLVPTWTLPIGMTGYGMLERRPGIGLADLLTRMNLRLADNLKKMSDTFILDTDRWVQLAGQEAFNPKLWYMGKIPFGNSIFKQAVSEIKSALTGLMGGAKKIILVDLDDTLWGGIVGEEGWQNLKLGGHDPTGEAFSDFQRALKSMSRRGILLGIISKNEEKVALEAIDKNSEMILKREDFVGWRINWSDKVDNILDLMEELKLGTQSVVFIDDHPIERARVREALPEVFVPDLPQDQMFYKQFLMSLNCFNTPKLSIEDRERTKMYKAESYRVGFKKKIGSLNDWLITLDTKIVIEEINKSNRQRASQLFNKTNQMNLTTRRMNETELMNWVNEKNRRIWIFRVSDKFGDSGLTGLLGIEHNESQIQVTDFLLSCRVMGRKIEEIMLHTASEYGRSLNLKKLIACYLMTEKNHPCYIFLKESGFEHDEKTDTFMWDLEDSYPKPDCIKIVNQEPDE